MVELTRRQLVAGVGGAVFIVTLVATLARSWGAEPVRRAVLIDELAVFEPNPTFVREVGARLAAAGYAMTYVPSKDVSVERLRSLPDDQADLIIVRAHAALIMDGGHWTDQAVLFSSEPVDLARFDVSGLPALDPSGGAGSLDPAATSMAVGASLLSADAAAALVPVRRTVGSDRRPYLGVGQRFIRDELRGRFRDDAVIVLMGCDTLRGGGLAAAFLDRGARAVIGWNSEVSAAHTDRATASFVEHFAVNGSVPDALRAVTNAVGPDPVSGAQLVADVR